MVKVVKTIDFWRAFTLTGLYPHRFQWPEWPMILRKKFGKGVAKRIAGTLRVSICAFPSPVIIQGQRNAVLLMPRMGSLAKVVGKLGRGFEPLPSKVSLVIWQRCLIKNSG